MGTVHQHIWDGLCQLETLRAPEPCFGPEAAVTTWDTHNRHVLALVRRVGKDRLVCLANFSGQEQMVVLDDMEGVFTDLITGRETLCSSFQIFTPAEQLQNDNILGGNHYETVRRQTGI